MFHSEKSRGVADPYYENNISSNAGSYHQICSHYCNLVTEAILLGAIKTYVEILLLNR